MAKKILLRLFYKHALHWNFFCVCVSCSTSGSLIKKILQHKHIENSSIQVLLAFLTQGKLQSESHINCNSYSLLHYGSPETILRELTNKEVIVISYSGK